MYLVDNKHICTGFKEARDMAKNMAKKEKRNVWIGNSHYIDENGKLHGE